MSNKNRNEFEKNKGIAEQTIQDVEDGLENPGLEEFKERDWVGLTSLLWRLHTIYPAEEKKNRNTIEEEIKNIVKERKIQKEKRDYHQLSIRIKTITNMTRDYYDIPKKIKKK